MNEQEWLSSNNTETMLAHIKDMVSPRKLRLFACACCYQLGTPSDVRSRHAILMAARFADDLISQTVLADAERRAWAVSGCTTSDIATTTSAWVATEPAYYAAYQVTWRLQSRIDTAAILREVVGNPFQPVVICPPLAGIYLQVRIRKSPGGVLLKVPDWLTPTVLDLAEAAYQESANGFLDPQRLLVLADAAEEAGCPHEILLQHLRGYEPCSLCAGTGITHYGGVPPYGKCGRCDGNKWLPKPSPCVTGCWVLDIFLGK